MNQATAKKKLKQAIHKKDSQVAHSVLERYPKLIWKLSSAERSRYYEL